MSTNERKIETGTASPEGEKSWEPIDKAFDELISNFATVGIELTRDMLRGRLNHAMRDRIYQGRRGEFTDIKYHSFNFIADRGIATLIISAIYRGTKPQKWHATVSFQKYTESQVKKYSPLWNLTDVTLQKNLGRREYKS